MSYLDIINYRRDWTYKSDFQNDLLSLFTSRFEYDQRDTLDTVINANYVIPQQLPYYLNNNMELIKQIIFIEGVDFLYRSINFLQAIQFNIEEGFFTASQSIAYQSSFYAARAILALSGIYCSSINNRNFLIETRYLEENQTSPSAICFTGTNKNHIVTWNLLQKLIQNTIIDDKIIDTKYFNIIKNINYPRYSEKRHDIHYYNLYQFTDLFSKISITPTGLLSLNSTNIESDKCYYFLVATLLIVFACNLFHSIEEYSTGLTDLDEKLFSLLDRNKNKVLNVIDFYSLIKINI